MLTPKVCHVYKCLSLCVCVLAGGHSLSTYVLQLADIVLQGLEGNEIVSLLTWINDYSCVYLSLLLHYSKLCKCVFTPKLVW